MLGNLHELQFQDFHVLELGELLEEGKTEGIIYTEGYHLENVLPKISDIYLKIKNEALKINSRIKINPQKYYISLRGKKNFAYLKLRKTKLHIIVMLPIEEGQKIINSHKVSPLSEGIQNFYNGRCFRVTIDQDRDLHEIIDSLKMHTLESNYKKLYILRIILLMLRIE